MTVTVAIPWRNRPDLLEHCVETVLGQTFRDIHVVVVGDGMEPPLGHIRDSRLDVWHIPQNRGAYYVRQLILLASGHQWHAPVDADDCVDPHHIETLLAQRKRLPFVAPNKLCGHMSGKCEHRGGTDGRVYGAGRYHVGLFRRDLLLSVGGYDPSERVGQDTMMLRILRLAYPNHIRTVDDPAYLSAPTYHRIRHPQSLTRDAATNHASELRKAAKKRNREVVVACMKLRLPGRIKAYREGRVPVAVRDELAGYVEALTARLGMEAAA
jgi:hypothetical protein